MSDKDTARADGLLAEALERHGARDPREYYRGQLRELRDEDRAAYDEAVAYYSETLVPAINAGEQDPLAAWTEYGRRLAALRADGRTLVVDETGASRDFELPGALGSLVLHLPDRNRDAAMIVALPAALSHAQQATVDFLVQRRRTLRETDG